MEKMSEKKRFSIVARVKSVNHAFRGFIILLKTGHNFWTHIFFGFFAIYLGFILKISSIEWAIIVFTVGLVLIVESINTAIEIDIDLTSPNYHPYARDTKDVSAAAVALSVLVAGIIGLIIFLPKILVLLIK
ncbi:MAG: diacylglycerol kinase family protein [Candidatus Nomurabacteria bacterium]|nr:diacylglycerol kinase family protein [Candidatus Nomurabacteria bacterium]